ncbi:LysM peptidoglycan-binding domain-containing protein [Paractinoplanes rhizophilus]|jgi:LysM repeat protein|uniref:LysM peptidoglycan-binding domain-containing protein n=1 Tax=Paractinoplanes rhizophilus TaxID=1416877 RepID=A0ABW2HSN2_9ACTN
MVAHGVRRAEPPLRLTRRGRVVVLVLFAALASVASAVLFTTASRASDDPSTPLPAITVRSGDTLWDIAAGVAPRRDAWSAVDEIRRLNHLGSGDLQPGQVLLLPRS